MNREHQDWLPDHGELSPWEVSAVLVAARAIWALEDGEIFPVFCLTEHTPRRADTEPSREVPF